MALPDNTVIVANRSGVVTLTLNRPDRRNALSESLLTRLESSLEETTPMVPLVRAISPKAALEMLLTGCPISADRALSLGLVNRVVPEDGLDAVVGEWAGAILAASPLTIRLGKAAFYDGLSLDEDSAYARATAVMVDNAGRGDAQAGMAAFLGKRRPEWSGS